MSNSASRLSSAAASSRSCASLGSTIGYAVVSGILLLGGPCGPSGTFFGRSVSPKAGSAAGSAIGSVVAFVGGFLFR